MRVGRRAARTRTDPEIVSAHVLGRFSEPKDEVRELIERAADELERLVTDSPQVTSRRSSSSAPNAPSASVQPISTSPAGTGASRSSTSSEPSAVWAPPSV